MNRCLCVCLLLSACSPAQPAEPPAAVVDASQPKTDDAKEKKASPDAHIQSVSVSDGKVADAREVVANMRGRFRACYREWLRSAERASGSVELVVKIGPHGEVLAIGGKSALPLKSVIPCLKAVVRPASFARPSPSRVHLYITVKLTSR